ncbi:MAG: hypothetical protein ACOH5I_01385 [Oligoflexus sp.]
MAQFTCAICGADFGQKSRYERHMMTSHPDQAISAAELEKALKGVNFPATRSELVMNVGLFVLIAIYFFLKQPLMLNGMYQGE